MGCEHAQAAGGQTSPSQFEENTLSEVKRVIAVLSGIAVFVDGEFWHGKDWEARKKRLKRNREYWIEKIEENMARDLRDDQLLMQVGWVPIHFWEKEVIKDLSTCVATIEEVILAQLIDSADTQEAIDLSLIHIDVYKRQGNS